MPQELVIDQTKVYALSVPLVNVAIGLLLAFKLPPLPTRMLQAPVSPAAGALAARVAVFPVKESWSGPALANVVVGAKLTARVSALLPHALEML